MEKKKKINKKKLSKSTKSFAHQHWEMFEILSLKIIDDIYSEKNDRITKLTSRQNDGGYDGIIYFSTHSYSGTSLYKVLLEAKLRSSSKHDLPLSDFSKTIIIAINTVADRLYICTNAYFSTETIRRLKLYSNRTGLDIRTIDIQSIVSWITKHPQESDLINDEVLIKKLLEMNRDLRLDQKSLVLNATIEENILQVPQLLGENRKRLLSELCKTISSQSGVLCIQGTMGSGKSIFLQNMMFQLRTSYKNITQLDLTILSDARSVFIKLLAVAWGETTNNIYAMSDKDLKDVTEYLGDQYFPERSRAALINMIRQPQNQFDENIKLHSELLLDFLHTIIPPIVKRVQNLFVITNIKNATQNALDFLCSFIKILPNKPISFLVALEDDERNCQYFLSQIKNTKSYLDTIHLPNWDRATAYQFLSQKTPWLPDEGKNELINYFGMLPLALSVGVEVFRLSDFGQVLKLVGENIPEIQLRYTLGCIDYIVEQFASRGGPEVQCAFTLLGIFDGVIEVDLLVATTNSIKLPTPIPFLSTCPFLKQTENKIQVLHGVYTNSISKLNFIIKSFLYIILEKIESKLETYFCDPEYIMRKRFHIFCLTRKFANICNIWMSLVASHMLREERQLAYQVLKTVYEWWMEDTITNYLSSYQQYWLLFNLSETTFLLFGADTQELYAYINQLDTLIQLTKYETWTENMESFQCIKANILNMKSQMELARANYHKMLFYAEEGIALILKDESIKGRNCLAALWADKAIALKHLENLSVCLKFLKSGKKMLMEARPFIFCYYTHLSSLHSSKNPRIALRYLKKIKLECNCSLSQELHTDHNIATMHFALGEYTLAAQISGRTWTRAYENHVPIELGRSEHLLGCIEWIKGNGVSAFERFEAAYQLFQKHMHHTHIWPPLINLSTLCIELGRNEQGLLYTKMAVELLLKYHVDTINNLEICSGNISKMYVGVLILLDNFCYFDSSDPIKENLLKQITLPDIHRAYKSIVLTGKLNTLLLENGYINLGKRVLKV